ncbi:HlyD family secretion protein [Thalassotalea euphylliae]|uniref:HlyD family secretion protein n=1 Tax=Thalassotalea euphylliae TaxID=1655234 RepID=UPI00363FC81B
MSEENTTTIEDSNKLEKTRKITIRLLIAALLYFVWYVVADRVTPMTEQARVRAFTIPIAPEVSGVVKKFHVAGDRPVKQGDILFEIDDQDYLLAVEQARAALELAGQEVGANTAAVASAKARLEKAKSDLNTKQIEAERIFAIEDEGVVSKSQADRTRGAVEQAKLEVVNAQAAYVQAQQTLGQVGQDNAKVQSALADLGKAELDLARTKVRAPSDGVVSYAKINIGHYASKGQKIMTFIATEHVWIEASYKENNLGNMQVGNPVDIALDSAPGTVFKGEVHSIGYGVSFDNSKPGELSKPEEPEGWMRDPQRFTVFIKFIDDNSRGFRREGGQADIITYTGGNFVMNALGKVWIWLVTLVSYVH